MSLKDSAITIISDDCLGGFVYKEVLKEIYTSPFIWTRIYTKDFIQLVKNIETINFEKYELIKEEGHANTLGILIDSKYPLYFHHVIYDESCKTPTVKNSDFGIDIHYAEPWIYVQEKYVERIKRITKNKVFIFNDIDNRISSDEIDELVEYIKSTEYRFILVSDKIKEDKKEGLILYLHAEPTWRFGKGGWHDDIMKHHAERIKEFLTNT